MKKIRPNLLEYFYACVILPYWLVISFIIIPCVIISIISGNALKNIPLSLYIFFSALLLSLSILYIIITIFYPQKVLFDNDKICWKANKDKIKFEISKKDIEKMLYVKRSFLFYPLHKEDFGMLTIYYYENNARHTCAFRIFRRTRNTLEKYGYKIFDV